jgi:hypothetical protein
MTPKQRVLKIEPKAFCESCGHDGLADLYQIVVPRSYGNVNVLSNAARSRREAWERAAKRIRSTGGAVPK